MQNAVAPTGTVHFIPRPRPAAPTLKQALPGSMFLVGEESRVVFAVLTHANVDASEEGARRWCVAVLSSDPQRPVGSLHPFDAATAVRPVALIHPAMLYVQPAWGGR
jgi:hypothetical protein